MTVKRSKLYVGAAVVGVVLLLAGVPVRTLLPFVLVAYMVGMHMGGHGGHGGGQGEGHGGDRAHDGGCGGHGAGGHDGRRTQLPPVAAPTDPTSHPPTATTDPSRHEGQHP